MSRLFALGYELPSLAAGAVEARSHRTSQLIEPLLADGHHVTLVVSHASTQLNVPHALGQRLAYHRLNLQAAGWRRTAQRLLQEAQPDGLVAVMFNNALRSTRLAARCPIWMDLYGDKLAETQAAQFAQGSARGFATTLYYLRQVLSAGDVFSACSTPQQQALIGQLGLAARLNRHTFGFEFVHTIRPGAPASLPTPPPPPAQLLAGMPPEACVVLWCGGYNVWTDVVTLYQGLSQAMASDPRVVFVSVGAGVRLAGNDSYERFLAQIAASPFRDRFHMLGWQPAQEVPGYYARASVGLNWDAQHYETMLGTRTRLVEMMRHGLPVITSRGCELSAIIEREGLGRVCPIGDAAALSAEILSLAGDPAARAALAERALAYTLRQLSFEETTQGLRRWAQRPYHAPDRASGRHLSRQAIEAWVRSRLRRLLWDLWALERGE